MKLNFFLHGLKGKGRINDENSTDEEVTLMMRNFKKFMKKKTFKKGDKDKRRRREHAMSVVK
jgi:hypothetical protein